MTMTTTSADRRTRTAGESLLTVEIVDTFGDGIAGEPVTVSYSPAVRMVTSAVAVTDASGRARLRAPGDARWLTIAHRGEVIEAHMPSGPIVIER